MSPRKTVLRKISSPPKIKGFKPYGNVNELDNVDKVLLHIEEFEAIKWCDYDKYTHCDASRMMGISRPTFTRIYSVARQKMAKAMVEGLQISIEGGKVYFDSEWYQCNECPAVFNTPELDESPFVCPICGCNLVTRCADDTAYSQTKKGCCKTKKSML